MDDSGRSESRGDSDSGTPDRTDTCSVCLELMIEPRHLKCRHIFCLRCLQSIEELHDGRIACPMCRDVTLLPVGQTAKHLPLAPVIRRPPPPRIVKTITMDCFAAFVTVDPQNQWILVATDLVKEPIKIYSFQGDYLGSMGENVIYASGPSVAKDTKRNRIFANTRTRIAVFDTEGACLRVIELPEFRNLQGLSYCGKTDAYLASDIDNRCIFVIDPETSVIRQTIDTDLENDTMPSKCYGVTGNVGTSSDLSEETPHTLANWAVTDQVNDCVKVISDCGVQLTGRNPNSDVSLDEPQGITTDYQGRILLVDGRNRVVRVDANGKKLDYVVPIGSFGTTKAHDLAVGPDGMLVVATFRHYLAGVGEPGTARDATESVIYIMSDYI